MSAPVVGIVGGVGSGKSSIARLVSERFTVALIDGDRAGHRVLRQPEVVRQLSQRFGDEILDENQQVRRAILAREVFGPDAESRRAKADLERIVHPRIREILNTEIETARSDQNTIAILLDAAVLFEAGWNDLCDSIVFIDTPRALRLSRVREGRGWDEAELDRREASQLSVEIKRNRADHVIDNSPSLDHSADALRKYLATLSATESSS